MHFISSLFCFFFIAYPLLAQIPTIPFQPEQYICYQAGSLIDADGKLEEPGWKNIAWTQNFEDIEGSLKPMPRFTTRAKMLWDENYFYVAAELEEPHIWATLTERESVIYYDNDFEVFIDPDGDTHNYYEFEVNALGTEWDLLLTKPYRDGGIAINGWNIEGVKVGISIEGTLNNPADVDKKWTLEMAFPWKVLKECAPGKRKPKSGEQWRVNFSRVEWQTEVVNRKYQKKINPTTGKSYPEDNWVWSPQGVIAMHQPETWGYVQFSNKRAGEEKEEFTANSDEQIKWALRQLYYAQRQWKRKNKTYTNNISALGNIQIPLKNYVFVPEIECTQSMFEIRANSTNGQFQWHIRQDGLLWKE
jgi:hypothetical protein